jgi:pyruvate,water dikinase
MSSSVWLTHLAGGDRAVWGRETLDLAVLERAGVSVLPAFVLLPELHHAFFATSSLRRKIQAACDDLSLKAPHAFAGAAQEMRQAIIATKFTEKERLHLSTMLAQFRHHLVASPTHPLPIRLRTTGDLTTHSLHGILINEEDLEVLIKQLWALAFTDRALYARYREGASIVPTPRPVLVQFYPEPELSITTIGSDLTTPDDTILTLQVQHGSARTRSQQHSTYRFDRRSKTLLSKEESEQWWSMTTQNRKISTKLATQKTLSEEKLNEVVRLAIQAQTAFPETREFSWLYYEKRFWVTDISSLLPTPSSPSTTDQFHVWGLPGSLGRATGKVRHIVTATDKKLLQDGEIAIVTQLSPDDAHWLLSAAAVVSVHGTASSVESMVAQHLGIPAVVGVGYQAAQFQSGQIITVDGYRGLIYPGKVMHEPIILAGNPTPTGTKIYASISDPYTSLSPERLSTWDGIGVVSSDAILHMLGLTFEEVVARGLADEYVDVLAEGMERIARAAGNRPVLFRLHDSDPHPVHQLHPRHKRPEPNPVLGYRGLHKLLKQPELLALELRALQHLAEQGMHNFALVLPMVRGKKEVIAFQKQLESSALARVFTPPLWVSCETPAVAILAEELCSTGIAGMFIDVSRLSRLVSGVDHENYQMVHEIDPGHPAVLQSVKYAVSTCHKHGVSSLLVSEIEGLSPEVVECAIRAGVSGISAIPEHIEELRWMTASVEKRLLLEHTLGLGAPES